MLEQLRRSFYKPSIGDDEDGLRGDRNWANDALGDASRLGLHLDLPLCRFSFCILPHSRAALNIFQPQYTLMFETLLATPEPWIYFHVLLPGGVDNLADPQFSLEPGTKAPLCGTLMQVVAVQREEDSRLSLIVQGLGRGIVVRSTQSLPYARADVQLLPDDEALVECAQRGRRFLASTDALEEARSTEGLEHRLVMAAASAEEKLWCGYEHANLTLSMHQTLSQVNATLAAPTAASEFDAIETALQRAPMAPAVCYRDSGWEPAEGQEEGQEVDDLYSGCAPVMDALTAAVEAANDAPDASAVATEEEVEAAQALLSLEHQLWVELDGLLRALASARGPSGKTPVPSQLLGLLPPPPAAGWPKDFLELGLGSSEAQLRERYEGALAEGEELGVARFFSYIPVDHENYPARRRAQRLSWAVWSVIGAQNVELQPLLDEQSTKERLRFALLRCRDIMKQLS